MILHIYADYDKRIGAYKITYILGRDYGIFISVGRVYRLMHSMQLPPISTIKPKSISRPKELSGCYANHLHQAFHQKAPNLSGQVILHISKPDVSGITFVSLWIFF